MSTQALSNPHRRFCVGAQLRPTAECGFTCWRRAAAAAGSYWTVVDALAVVLSFDLDEAKRRDALERAVRNDSVWERESELPELLRKHRLPDTRDSLHRSLA
jgi:hypothetical protein